MARIRLSKLRADIDALQVHRGGGYEREAWINPQWRQNVMRAAAKRLERSTAWRIRLMFLMKELGVTSLRTAAMCKKYGPEDIVVPCTEAAPARDFVEVTAYYDGDRIVAYRRKDRLTKLVK